MTAQQPPTQPEPPVTVDANTLALIKWLEAIHHETKVASSRLGWVLFLILAILSLQLLSGFFGALLR